MADQFKPVDKKLMKWAQSLAKDPGEFSYVLYNQARSIQERDVRIRDLEAEVEKVGNDAGRLGSALVGERARREAAEAKLAAIEGVQRYDFRNGDPYERFEAWMPEDDNGDWIKAADIHAILRGESEAP